MCRYLSFTESEIIAAQTLLQLPNRGAFVPDKGEIYPSQTAPILINSGYDVACTDGRWGFARWDGKGVLINARSETAHSSRVFSPYYTTERCLVPAHGYFEWRKTGKTSENTFSPATAGFISPGSCAWSRMPCWRLSFSRARRRRSLWKSTTGCRSSCRMRI